MCCVVTATCSSGHRPFRPAFLTHRFGDRRDAPYWNIYPEKHGVIWGALEDVSVANGTMSVLPGWHIKGCLPREGSNTGGGFTHNINPTVLPEHPENVQFDYDFTAGTVALHDIMMPHTSGPNLTDRHRRAFNLRYCSADGVLGQNSYTNPMTGAI